MGAYVYGYSKSEKEALDIKSGLKVVLGLVKYIYKPSYSAFYKPSPYVERKLSRYTNQNEGRELPCYVCVEKFEDGAAIYDMSTRPMHSTFYDDPYGFGDWIGMLKKHKGKFVFYRFSEEERSMDNPDFRIKDKLEKFS